MHRRNIGISSVALFINTYFLYFPLYVYLSNYNELNVPLLHLLIILISISFFSTIFFLLLFKIANLISLNLSKILRIILIVVSFLAWIYGSIINWNYGLFDGTSFTWNYYLLRNLIDIVVLVITSLFILRLFNYQKVVVNFCLIVILMQLLYLVTIFFKLDLRLIGHSYKNFNINYDEISKFSKNRNYIVLVLDSFQTDVLIEMLEKGVVDQREYYGFELYKNNLGGFPRTYPSIPLILTGEYYDNSQPIQLFIKEAFENSSIFIPLKEKGFRNEIYPLVNKTIYPLDQIDNIKKKYIYDNKKDVLKIFITGLYKLSPSFIKRIIYDKSNINVIVQEEGSGDNNLLNKINNNIEFVYDEPVFKYIHLTGVHQPLTLGENFEFKNDIDFNRNNVVDQGRILFKKIEEIVFNFKKNEKFDDLFLAIIGDHGNEALPLYTDNTTNYSEVSDSVLSASTPLLLVKHSFSNNNIFEINNLYITQSDFKNFILADLEHRTVELNNNAVRKFFMFQWSDKYWFWQNDYLSDLIEYEVRGDVWNKSSWSRTGITLSSPNVKKIETNFFELGLKEEIYFGKNSPYLSYLISGWSWPGDGFVMADSNVSSIKIPLNQIIYEDLNLEIGLMGLYIPKNKSEQKMQIWVENTLIKEFILNEGNHKMLSVKIDKVLLEGKNVIKLGFVFPDATSPKEDATGTDSRVRSVGIRYLLFK